MKLIIFVLIIFVFNVNLKAQISENYRTYTNEIKNFSFSIPTSWKQLSRDYLESAAAVIGNDVYDVGFYKYGNAETGFHPIITSTFRKFKINEKDYNSIAAKLISDSKLDNLKSLASSSEAKEIVNNMKLNQAYFDNKLKRLYFNFGFFENGKLVGKSVSIILFSTKGLLTIQILDNPEDLNKNIKVFYEIVKSIKY